MCWPQGLAATGVQARGMSRQLGCAVRGERCYPVAATAGMASAEPQGMRYDRSTFAGDAAVGYRVPKRPLFSHVHRAPLVGWLLSRRVVAASADGPAQNRQRSEQIGCERFRSVRLLPAELGPPEVTVGSRGAINRTQQVQLLDD